MLRGAVLCLPVAVSVAAYGAVFGVLARTAGLSFLEVALMSGFVFAGSAQFVALDLWNTPDSLPIGALVLAALIVNLRYLLITATLRPLFGRVPPVQGALAMFLVTDENWAVTVGEMAKGRASPAFLLGGGLLAWCCWMLSTLLGRLLGAAIEDPARYGLDFAFTATFLALLLGMWQGRSDLLPWSISGAVAILAERAVPGSWYILIGALAGSLAAAGRDTWGSGARV